MKAFCSCLVIGKHVELDESSQINVNLLLKFGGGIKH